MFIVRLTPRPPRSREHGHALLPDGIVARVALALTAAAKAVPLIEGPRHIDAAVLQEAPQHARHSDAALLASVAANETPQHCASHRWHQRHKLALHIRDHLVEPVVEADPPHQLVVPAISAPHPVDSVVRLAKEPPAVQYYVSAWHKAAGELWRDLATIAPPIHNKLDSRPSPWVDVRDTRWPWRWEQLVVVVFSCVAGRGDIPVWWFWFIHELQLQLDAWLW